MGLQLVSRKYRSIFQALIMRLKVSVELVGHEYLVVRAVIVENCLVVEVVEKKDGGGFSVACRDYLSPPKGRTCIIFNDCKKKTGPWCTGKVKF